MKPLYIGIDISKLTLDICKLENGESTSYQIKNEYKSIALFFSDLSARQPVIAMENTGRYNWNLYEYFAETKFEVYVLQPLHLKKSMGLTRGKTDEIDAKRIAKYISKNSQEHTVWEPESEGVTHLKILLAERRLLLKQRKQLLVTKEGLTTITNPTFQKAALKRNHKRVVEVDRHIAEIEAIIQDLIKQDVELNIHYKLICSVPGVGKVTAWAILAKTNCFKRLNSPRQLACFAGVVPFSFQSGTSIGKRPAVSNLADKELKSLLHMCAISSLNSDKEIITFFKRKVEQGKNKMSVVNAIRNKIIHRICAVVRDQRMWEVRLVNP